MTNVNKSISLYKGLKVLSLCGGVETGLFALQKLNIPISEYHTYEILPEAIAVSKFHFPFVVHHGDLYDADFHNYIGFDLLLVGTNCQSLSRCRIENKNVSNVVFLANLEFSIKPLKLFKLLNPIIICLKMLYQIKNVISMK